MNKNDIPNKEKEVLENNEIPVDNQMNKQEVSTENGDDNEKASTSDSAEVGEQTATSEKKKKKGWNIFGDSDKKTEKQKKELEALKAQKSELNDKYLRLLAEFQNYRRRMAKERVELMQTAGKDVIKVLLPVLDDFDRAKKAAEAEDNTEPFSEGVMLVYNKLKNVLSQKGLKEMETTGKTFDVNIHHALTEIPAPTEELKGKIIDTIEKGYKLNDKIIRYARVVVGK